MASLKVVSAIFLSWSVIFLSLGTRSPILVSKKAPIIWSIIMLDIIF